jgi:hypothetical protein
MMTPVGEDALITPTRGIPWIDRAVLVISLLCLSGVISAFLGTQPTSEHGDLEIKGIEETGDAAKQAVLLGIYALNLALLLYRMRLRALLFVGTPILLLTSWCFLSVAWSAMPDGTLRRAVALLGPVIIGLLTGLRFNEM